MKFEKRNADGSAPASEDPVQKEKRPVILYILILFIVAFLLMALSFAMHQRSNTQALGELKDSVGTIQEVQGLQEQIISLEEQLRQSEANADAVQAQLTEQAAQIETAQTELDALTALCDLQQSWLNEDVDTALQIMQQMDEQDLDDALSKKAAAPGLLSPAECYLQIKESLLNT